VIRFDEFTTTRSHIQGSGRARAQRAQVYYFMNNPDEEEKRANIMQSVARDIDMAATQELIELEEEKEAKRRNKGEGVHPFQEPGKQDITLFNGQEIVYGWCQQVMGSSFSAAKLLKYAAEHEGGKLLSVTIPSPDGEYVVKALHVEERWKNLKPKDVIDPTMLRKVGGKDLDLRCALFVVAIHMRGHGWISGGNEPHTMYFKLAKCKYEAPPQTERVSIGKTFARPLPEVKEGNMVSALNEWAQKKWKSSKNVSYSSMRVDDLWKATVTILPMADTSFTGEGCVNKKSAEQSAAKKAWDHLTQL